jgi:nucleotide-binding universal stress UspA family protein
MPDRAKADTMARPYKETGMEKILVPFDGSESAKRALHYVCDQVKTLSGTEVLLLHVVDPYAVDPETGSWQRADKSAFLEEGERVLMPAKHLLDDAGVAYQSSVVFGSPGNEIAAYAKRKECTAIVMGTRGLSAITSIFIGSVAHRVMQFADVPVTLVK